MSQPAACERKKGGLEIGVHHLVPVGFRKVSESARRMMPALLTRTSRCPNTATTASTSGAGHIGAAEVGLDELRKRRPANDIDGARSLVRRRGTPISFDVGAGRPGRWRCPGRYRDSRR